MKKLTSLCLAIALLGGGLSFSAMAVGKTIVESDFSTSVKGIGLLPNQRAEITVDPIDSSDKVILLEKIDESKTGEASMAQLSIEFPDQKGIFTVEADVYLDKGALWFVATEGAVFPYGPGMVFGPNLLAFDGSAQTGKGVGIAKGTWQRIAVEINPISGTYAVYCNGKLENEIAFKFRNESLKSINKAILRTPSGKDEGKLYVDNVKVYEGACDKASTITKKTMDISTIPTPTQDPNSPADESKYEMKNNAKMKEFYVSPTGSDAAGGTKEAPFQTIEKAVQAVSALTSAMTGDIIVNIMPGEYYIKKSIKLGAGDSGKGDYQIVYKAVEGPTTVRLFGAKALSGWTKDKGDIWKTKVDNDFYTLYEQDTRAIKARYPNREYNPEYATSRAPYLLTNDPDTKGFDKIIYKAEDLKDITFLDYADANIVVWPWNKADWNMWTSPIESIDKSKNTITAKYKVPSTPIGLNARYYIEGMYELLDAPGEFHLNRSTKTLYYIPRNGSDPNQEVKVYAPTTQELFALSNARNIVFDGISFEKTDFVDGMKSWYEHWGDKDIWKGAITFSNVSEVKITHCRFKNTGLTGVFMKDSAKYNYIANSLFENIGNSGVVMITGVGENMKYNKIENVLIHDIGENSVDCAGVNIFTGQGNIITNVEVYNSPRYGVSIRGGAPSYGWWKKPDDLNNEKYSGRSRNNIVKNSKFYETNQDSGDTGSIHTAGVSFGVAPYNTNYFENLYIDSIYAHPSMKDWGPNGIFADYQSFGQSYKNIKITNQAGGEYPQAPATFTSKSQLRYNETDPLTGEYNNVSWMDGFDDGKMDYVNMGLTSAYPSFLMPDFEKMKKAVILEEGASAAMVRGILTSIDTNNPAVMPINISDRLLVPIRFIAESFGAEVTWNEPVATIKLGDKLIEFTENQAEMKINGAAKAIDVPVRMMNGRTMVPIRAVAESLGMEVVYLDGFVSISDKKALFDPLRDDMTIKRIGTQLLTGYKPQNFNFKQITTAGLKDYSASYTIKKPGTGIMVRTSAATNAAFVGVVNVEGVGLRLYERSDNYKIPTFTDLGITDVAEIKILSTGGKLIISAGDLQIYNKENPFVMPLVGAYSIDGRADSIDINYGTITLSGGKAEKIALSTVDNVLEKDQKLKLVLSAVDESGKAYNLLSEKPEFISSNPTAVAIEGGFAVGKGVGKAVISTKVEIDGKVFHAEKELEGVLFNKVLINEAFDKETFAQDAWKFTVTDQTNGSYVKLNDEGKLEVNAQAGKLISALRSFNQFSGKITIEFDFKAQFSNTGKKSGAMLAYLFGDGNTFCVSTFAYEGTFSYFADGAMHNFGKCESGKEYKIRIDTDVTANTMDIYVDGIKEVTGAKFRNPAQSLGGIQVGCTSDAEDTKLWWDNIKVIKEQ